MMSDEEVEDRLNKHVEGRGGSKKTADKDHERLLRPMEQAREKLKLIACSQYGDSSGMADILEECPEINVDLVEDQLGRSLLAVAVRNDQPEVQLWTGRLQNPLSTI